MTRTTLSKTEARQGETPHVVRYVLTISTIAAALALAATLWLAV